MYGILLILADSKFAVAIYGLEYIVFIEFNIKSKNQWYKDKNVSKYKQFYCFLTFHKRIAFKFRSHIYLSHMELVYVYTLHTKLFWEIVLFGIKSLKKNFLHKYNMPFQRKAFVDERIIINEYTICKYAKTQITKLHHFLWSKNHMMIYYCIIYKNFVCGFFFSFIKFSIQMW